MKSFLRGLVCCSVATAVVAFFLPWSTIAVSAPNWTKQLRELGALPGTTGSLTQGLGTIEVTVRRGTDTVHADLSSLANVPRHVSGAQIPRMAHPGNAQVAIALVELFTRQHRHLGVKSYAVYVVPGVALLCGLLLLWCGHRPAVALGVALCCAGIAGAGWWKLLTMDTRTPLIAIAIREGLWLSLWAYVGLGAAAMALILFGRSRAGA